jgi:hypothetical protein
MSQLVQCSKCRGYDLERKWCEVCGGKGVVDMDRPDRAAEIQQSARLAPDEEKIYVVNGREQKERPRCVVRGCDRFADSPWTTCQEHWR